MLVSRVKHRVIMDKDEINEGNTVSSSPASHSPASQVLVGVASSSSSSSLHDMSSLSQHLPLKRGLSEYYKGKSQSFTSLSNVRCLEDLAKPENPYKKKLKSCKSYGGGLLMEEANEETYNYKLSFPKPLHPRILSKTPPRKCCSQMNLNANKRPPIPIPILIPIPVPVPPHTSPTSNRISNQTPLFA